MAPRFEPQFQDLVRPTPARTRARAYPVPHPVTHEPFWPWEWNPAEFAQACDALRQLPEVSAHVSRSRYPLHMIRYWLTARLMLPHLRGHPGPRVMEIGVDRGQFFHFCRALPQWIDGTRWHGADVSPQARSLTGEGYEAVHLADFSDATAVQALVDDPDHRGQYDAVVVLHFLEHLRDPEACLARIRHLLKPGGVLVGGMPSCPEFARRARERQIRRTATPFGHQSVFSVERVSQGLEAVGLTHQRITGAFFARSRNSRLEDSAAWLRANLWFGELFPRWPGELYFAASQQRLPRA